VEDHGFLFGSSNPDDVIARLTSTDVAEMVVKFVTPACQVVASGVSQIVTANPVAGVIDTTAAGDSFAAAYMAARLSGLGPVDAASSGHRLAGVVVCHRGAIIPKSAMPSISFASETL
jgi:2-dehydro-3-deoxygluconokinase